MTRSQAEKKREGAVSLGDVFLRPTEILLIHAPNWLPDTVIAFWVEHATLIKYKPIMQNVVLLPPSICFLLAQSQPDQVPDILKSLHIQGKDYILFPTNDHSSITTAGGSHWSLLVFERKSGKFRHYDSSQGRSSRLAATRLFRQVHETLAPGIATSLSQVDLMPQQENGYDCGIYVLKMMDLICEWCWLEAKTDSEEEGDSILERHDDELASVLTRDSIMEFRDQLLDIVNSFR